MMAEASMSDSSKQPIQILIVGAGAVGCFYGSRLHQPSHTPPIQVSLICRSNYPTISSNGGVQLKSPTFGSYFFKPSHIFPSIQSASESGIKWDYIVVATKALPDISDDSARIETLVWEGATIVLIQNGVGVEEPYRKRFKDTIILSGVTVVSAEQVEDGVVVHNRWTRISLGPYTDGFGNPSSSSDNPESLKTSEFVELLKAGGIKDAESYDERNLQRVRWHKIAINAAMNPSAVLSSGYTNFEMVQIPLLREHLRQTMLEILNAAASVLKEPLTSSTYLKSIHLATPEEILKSTERNKGGKPSMLVDWERGGSMELEVILGNPIRAAKSVGVDMPRVETMYAFLKAAQKKRQEEKTSGAKSKL